MGRDAIYQRSRVAFAINECNEYVRLNYILDTTTGLLVKAAIEWLEKQEEV